MKNLSRAIVCIALCAASTRGFAQSSVVDDIRQKLGHGLHNLEKDLYGSGSQNMDEAMLAQIAHGNVNIEALKQGSSEDYFKAMDYGITLPKNQEKLLEALRPYFGGNLSGDEARRRMARGRNNWIVWTAGNDRFWTFMTRATLGGLDFVKTVSDYPSLPSVRHNRWLISGLVNEPCFVEATGPREDRWGLWLPTRLHNADCPDDPFEDASKYPGIQIGYRGQTLAYDYDSNGQHKTGQRVLEVGSFYGYASGVIGLRLFTNPDFGPEQAKAWQPDAFYRNADYYKDPRLVRPYRVGMACGFCHVGPNPSHLPKDFSNPRWEDLTSNAGAQYWWFDRIFDAEWSKDKDSFIYQLLHTARPGTVDTSLVSSDMINNPRTMNAVYDLPSRVQAAMDFNDVEVLKGDENLNAQFSKVNDPRVVPANSPLVTALGSGSTIISPRVLKDGSDSVGALGALNRVYVNIGLFSEEWIHDFIPVLGGPTFFPFSIDLASKNSIYWQANVAQTPDVALFFLAATPPDKLTAALTYSDRVNGKAAVAATERPLPAGDPTIEKGKHTFAKYCAQCHSSKQPPTAYSFFKKGSTDCAGPGYLKCWNSYWDYTKTPEYKTAIDEIVTDPHFLEHNFLSTDLRVPDTLLDSQLCSPVATNAIKNDTWDNFSSSTYKTLTPIGKFLVNYPQADGSMKSEWVTVPGGGRGYLRPASLISVWATAPYLQNNSLGKFRPEGTLAARLDSFYDSIDKLLLMDPDKRGEGANIRIGEKVVKFNNGFGAQLSGIMDVTTQTSYIKIPKSYLPAALYAILKKVTDSLPSEVQNKMHFKTAGLGAPSWRDKERSVASEAPAEKPKKNMVQRMIASIFSWGSDGGDEGLTANYTDSEAAEAFYLGPIPKGTPVNLIANIDLAYLKTDPLKLDNAISHLILAFGELQARVLKAQVEGTTYDLDGDKAEEALQLFMEKAAGPLLSVSKCNDFVVNRGHYFGTPYGPPNTPDGQVEAMGADEKKALIEFLKTM